MMASRHSGQATTGLTTSQQALRQLTCNLFSPGSGNLHASAPCVPLWNTGLCQPP